MNLLKFASTVAAISLQEASQCNVPHTAKLPMERMGSMNENLVW